MQSTLWNRTSPRETLEYHHGKHQQHLRGQPGTTWCRVPSLKASLWKRSSRPPLAASSTTPPRSGTTPSTGTASPRNGGGEPTGALADAITKAFGSFAEFKRCLHQVSPSATPGSSWTWLVKKADGSLAIVNTSNASCPLTEAGTTLLTVTVDLWEHRPTTSISATCVRKYHAKPSGPWSTGIPGQEPGCLISLSSKCPALAARFYGRRFRSHEKAPGRLCQT